MIVFVRIARVANAEKCEKEFDGFTLKARQNCGTKDT
jgi:hypothetical protein